MIRGQLILASWQAGACVKYWYIVYWYIVEVRIHRSGTKFWDSGRVTGLPGIGLKSWVLSGSATIRSELRKTVYSPAQ
jgi:hypothetical protein